MRYITFPFAIALFTLSMSAQTIQKISFDDRDSTFGHYLVVEPRERDSIAGVLILLAGFGQQAEDTPPETKLHNVAYTNRLLTVFFACGNKLYADSVTQGRLTSVISDVRRRYSVSPDNFVLGGFSAGGMIAMRYAELCAEHPEKSPIRPAGVFTVDSPIDIFTVYDLLELALKNKYSDLAVEEAQRAINFIKSDYGIPRENIRTYAKLTAFSMDPSLSQNERYLANIAVRTYHDVDIAWRIINRNQTVHLSNYEVTSELINRLVLMGNTRAEFMQTYQTGYRSNGQRHPHSWSIVNEVECIQWEIRLLH